MDGWAALLAGATGAGLLLGGGALLRPRRTAPPPPRAASLAWVAQDDDATGAWATRPILEGRARIVALARDVLTGRRVEAVCLLRPATEAIGATRRGGFGPWDWDPPLGTPLVLEVSSPAHRSAAGPVEMPPWPGGARGVTVWLIPLGALLVGKVEDAGGRPVAGAEVALELPGDGDGSLDLAARRIHDAAIPIPGWRAHLLGVFTWKTRTDAGGAFTLAAAPGQSVRVVARHGGRSVERACVVTSDATPLPPLRLTSPDRPAPATPELPPIDGEPPGGTIALAVRAADGGPCAARVTLHDGDDVVARAESRGQWTELRGPSRRPLVLGVEPDERGVRLGQHLTLMPGDRLWLGEWRLGPKGERP